MLVFRVKCQNVEQMVSDILHRLEDSTQTHKKLSFLIRGSRGGGVNENISFHIKILLMVPIGNRKSSYACSVAFTHNYLLFNWIMDIHFIKPKKKTQNKH